MSEGSATTQEPVPRKRKWIARSIVYGLMVFVFSVLSSCSALIEVPVRFAVGWFLHARETLPPLTGKWPALILPSGCLLAAGFLSHQFIRWWLREKGKPLSWRPAHTLSAITLLLLGVGAAIAMSGIAHQLAWLSGDPLIENRGRRTQQAQAVNNARQIMFAMMDFQQEHERYPASFEELQSELDLPPEVFRVKIGHRGMHEPFIYLKPGEFRSLNGNEPVILSPVFPDGNRVVVGYSDSSVRTLTAREFESIVQSHEPITGQTR